LLAQYVPGFDPSFVALYGTPEQIAATAKEFKIFYQKVPGTTATSYTMDHTAGSYVIDKDGRVRLFIRHGASVDDIVSDLRKLL
jgi:protein SCO1/2